MDVDSAKLTREEAAFEALCVALTSTAGKLPNEQLTKIVRACMEELRGAGLFDEPKAAAGDLRSKTLLAALETWLSEPIPCMPAAGARVGYSLAAADIKKIVRKAKEAAHDRA